MESAELPAPDEGQRARGIRVAGIGFILVFMSGIVDLLTMNMLWPVLTITGFVFIVAGLWMAQKN